VAERTRELAAAIEELQKEITARKRAEEELRKSNRRIEDILESITDEFNAFDREWRFTYLNEPALNSIRRAKGKELTREEVLGKNVWKMFPAHVGSVFYQKYHDAMREQKTVEFEARSPVTDRWIEVNACPSEEGLSIYYRDITERKRVEEKLRRSEAYLAEGQRISHTGSWVVRFPSEDVFWTQEVYRIYGLDPATTKLSQQMAFQLIHPEDRPFVKEAFERALREKSDYAVEHRAILPDGSIKHLHALGHPVLNESSTLTEYVGTVMDITERKRAEELLRKAHERVEMILDSITDQFFALSEDWRFTYLNKHAAEQTKILGKDPARLIGKVLWDEFPYVPNEEALRRVMSERVAITDQLYYPPLGEWVENHMYPSPDGGLVTFQKYITERKRRKRSCAAVRPSWPRRKD
jgi:PAS domain S-box-containing protein